MGLCGTGPLLEATGLHHRTVQGEGTNIDISTTQKFIRLAINKSFSNCNSVTSNFVDNGRGQKQKPLDLQDLFPLSWPQHGIEALTKCDSGQ